MSCEFQRTKAECTQLFVRAARRKFSEILQFFCAILAQRLRDLDAERALFRIGTHFQLGQLQQRFATCAALAGRVHAVFCARDVPEFRKFWNFFARVWQQKLRDIDARRAPFHIWTHFRLSQQMQRRSSAHAAHAGRVQAISLRAARQNSGKFAIFSNRLLRKICVISARHLEFFAFQRTADSVKSYSEVLRFFEPKLDDCTLILCAW